MKIKHLFILVFISAIAAIYSELIESSLYTYLKPLTTILVLTIPLLFAEETDKRFRWLMSIGLVFCLAGDVLLLNDQRFIYGLVAFLIAHLLFCYVFFYKNKNKLIFKPLIPFALVGGSYYLFLLSNLGDIALPVAIYITVIVVMSWLALELYLADKNTKHFAIASGAVLFLVSDSILAFNKFVTAFDYAGLLILSTYWLAISLFSYATVRETKNG